VTFIALEDSFFAVYTFYTTKAIDYDNVSDDQYSRLPTGLNNIEKSVAKYQAPEKPNKQWSVARLLSMCPRLVLMSRSQLTDYRIAGEARLRHFYY
jgi:hypothetical protein